MSRVPLKHLVDVNQRSLAEDTGPDQLIHYIDIGSVGTGLLVDEPKSMPFGEAPSRARRLVRDGDTIVSTVRTYLRAVWPVRGRTEELVVSTGFAVLTPRPELDPRYLGWMAQSDPFVDAIVARSVGVSYPAINPSEIGELRVDLPSLRLQRAIADYLDTETARIDALIAKKHRLVDAVRIRLAVFRHACVTAVDRHERRDAAWLGTVPRTWDVASLRRVARLHMGTTFPHEFQGKESGDLPVVKVGDLVRTDATGVLQSAGNWIDASTAQHLKARMVPARSVLYARVGAAMLLNPRAINPWACMLDDNVRGLEFHGVLPEFGLEVMRLLDLGELTNPGPVPSIGEEQVMSVQFPVPPIEQQQQIVETIRRTSERESLLRASLQSQIALLREHQQALVTAAVTGELTIPGVA